MFLMLTLAIMEFATLLFVRHVMLNAAQDAARSYAIREVDSAGAIALATERLGAMNVSFSITATADADSGLDRSVEISAPIDEAALGDPLHLLGGGAVTVRVTMRREEG